jgi:uncharacterized membrane protein
MKLVAALVAGLALLASPARAATSFDFIFDGGYPLAVSSDGSVVAGNLADGFVPFRWTQATGVVSLGRPSIVGGGGTPGMSADGTVIASTIGALDSSYATQGVWTLAGGWQELMPPGPPDLGITDGSYGSIWGLSGDGATAVGLYWRSGFGRAHASKWTQATGVVDLGGMANNQAGRANAVNHDGSVIVGWVETPTGPWRPAAWVDGSLVLLTDYREAAGIPIGHGEGRATNPSGDIIVGFARDSASNQRAATMWKRTGGVFGPPQVLGWVDGSEPAYGINIANAVSSSGKIVVGYASFDGSPFGTTGFVWTAETGVVDVNVFLADHGVLVDPNFTIQSLGAMTPDGTKIFGHGQMLIPPYTRRAFRITTTDVVAVPAPETQVARLELSAPRPNPSSATTRLELTLSSASNVDLSIYDASGRRVAVLLQGDLPAGRRSVAWDGRETGGRRVPTGLYFARLSTAEGTATRRIVRVD